MHKVLMPRLDAGMREGIIVEWLKKEGDTINKGDPLLTIEGEKTVFDVEAQTSGVLSRVLAEKGSVVPVGESVAIITEEGEDSPKEKITFERLEEERVLVTPAAKRVARDRNIDLSKIKGSGSAGTRLEQGLPQVVETKDSESKRLESPLPLEVSEIIPVVGMRKTIARRLTHSYRMTPHVAITMEVDMTRALEKQKEISETLGGKIPLTALLVKVTAKALKDNPLMNSAFEKDQIRLFKDINVGVAVAIEEGLIVPVLHNAERKSLSESATLLTELFGKAKARSLSPEELQGGTFTITNLGSFDVETFTPIINPPQAAILGVGKISERPIAINKEIRISSMMTLTLVFDHRIMDGAKAAQFLKEIKELIENIDSMYS